MKKFNVLVEGYGATAAQIAEELKDNGVEVQDIKKTVVSVGGLAELMFVLKCESTTHTFENIRDKMGFRQTSFMGGTSLI